ncbi:TetR/AcrR family transcriptional regulator [Gandjariella thermophila]|uniref:TetR family transcriptional regulator n=1 Tax=Gandjariella thermophila TaxID=1931992 RepID=A0A4D4IZB4_9PSEU|nr:TetR/AcrR family transcriptional regulator [Gandjariella thermophila]GDY29685.1 TetR family transcriptional regulator [Gandjariella thermophila]
MTADRAETRLDEDARWARAERILDAATDLLLRWGYKRVTVDEVAKRASVGKGTVYLHWKTRDALLYAAVLREWLEMFGALIDGIRRDPEELRLHRLIRASFLASMERPLIRATLTQDQELLGRLTEYGAGGALQAEQTAARREYYAMLREHGLLRTDLDPDTQAYALSATSTGFYLATPLVIAEQRPDLSAQADALAWTVRNAFEPVPPAGAAAVRALAPTIIRLFERQRAFAERELRVQHQP